jgi:hypothetical protein
MKIYGPNAYIAARDMLDYVAFSEDSVAAMELWNKFMARRFLASCSNEAFIGEWSLYVFPNGEISFDFVDEHAGLECVQTMIDFVLHDRKKLARTTNDKFVKLSKALADGGTDWNIPFDLIKTAKLEVLLKEDKGVEFLNEFRLGG